MSRDFIELYDDDGYRYIVNMDKISFVNVAGRIVGLELETSVMLDVSVNGSCGDCVSADVTADAYIEDIKYCPFCGEEL